jgi:ABC-type Fe3+/spermidine/putrescine transport system ATPase subunit
VYEEPATRFVEEFLGDVTVVEGDVSRAGGRTLVRTPLGEVALPERVTDPGTDSVAVALRPDAASIERATPTASAQTDGTGAVRLDGTVSDVLYQGSRTQYYVDVGGDVAPFVEYSRRTDPDIDAGADVTLRWAPDAVHFYDATGERL